MHHDMFHMLIFCYCSNLEGKSPIYLAIKDPELKTLLEQYAEQETVNTEGEVTEDVHTEEVSGTFIPFITLIFNFLYVMVCFLVASSL